MQDNESLKDNIFRVGKVTFRLGNMFDLEVLDESDILVLPASTTGAVTDYVAQKIREFDARYPYPDVLGSIKQLTATINKKKASIVYAYSVEDDVYSDLNAIVLICDKLKNIKSERGRQLMVNMPLLGTGAGRLKALQVARVYDEEFNDSENSTGIADYIINVLELKDFELIRRHFKTQYIPKNILDLEKELKIRINRSQFTISPKGNASSFDFSNTGISDIGFVKKFPELKVLNFSSCPIRKYDDLCSLDKLFDLNLSNNIIENYEFISKIKSLQSLRLSGNKLKNIDFLKEVKIRQLYIDRNKIQSLEPLRENKKLVFLDATSNLIKDLTPLSSLNNLETLFIADNQIKDLTPIIALKNKLSTLVLSKNNINDISPLGELRKLSLLSVDDNFVDDINPLTSLSQLAIINLKDNRISDADVILSLPKLRFIQIDNNPLVEGDKVILEGNTNHLSAITNYLLRRREKQNLDLILPAKVLLLGNHASGKSSLLQYIQQGKVSTENTSTHIIKIEKFPDATGIPEAIFFDFGGQDYYHGIYRAFLSGGSIYLILWNLSSNLNTQRQDSNDVVTQDFTLKYWLSQKKYLENEKFGGKIDPVFLIQSHADVPNNRRLSGELYPNYDIENEFYLSLASDKTIEKHEIKEVNEQALKYFKASLLHAIKGKRVVRREPKWYVDFIDFILTQNNLNDYHSKDLSTGIMQYYNRKEQNNLELLQDDLDQLHKQGLVLYYREQIPDKVWLNPVALVKYVHEHVLNKENIGSFNGKVPIDFFDKFDDDIISLLCLQKVIFKHESENEYIIPNFLPLVSEDNSNVDIALYTFGFDKPTFTLKFENFLPFGLINQIICFLGQLPNKKKFWRDQVLFTFQEKAKVLIYIDFKNLEIKTYSSFKKDFEREKEALVRYLFYVILGLYWDLSLFDIEQYTQFIDGKIKKNNNDIDDLVNIKIQHYESLYDNPACKPIDLLISVDDRNFISYSELCSSQNDVMISAKILNEYHHFDDYTKPIPIFPFQPFTKRQLRKKKRVAISYSKKDLKLVNKFKQYLVPLFQDELIDSPWYCTELIAGSDWNDEIQKKFDEADVIFFMISENLMSTQYVLEHEIKNAINKWKKDPNSIKIVPIILRSYHWKREGEYDLSKFTGLPYTLKPVTDFPNQALAWHSISESIRIMIDYDVNSGIVNTGLTSELLAIYERITGENVSIL